MAGREVIEMATTSSATVAEKGRRIVGAERQTLAKDLVKRYTSGESIRALASSTGRSYGFVHRVLTESGVQLRQRGGARRRKKVAS
jgi:predicted transcriptional regulator